MTSENASPDPASPAAAGLGSSDASEEATFFLVRHQVLLVIDIDDGKSGPVFEETLD